ncbi:hypothetical protein MMC11_002575 [Xylographa trunciseda]|nr:hypothetical protein [Xylographa trunciseda]
MEAGPGNTAQWIAIEDKVQQRGIPVLLQTAVLLKRSDDTRFVATIQIETKVDGGFSLARKIENLSGGTSKDAPVIFDPAIVSTNTHFDTNDLEAYDLNTLVKLQTALPLVDADGLESHLATSTTTTYGAALPENQPIPQTLLGFFRGYTSPLRYTFRTFERLSLLNLFKRQHELLMLDKRLNDAQGDMSPEDNASLSRLLREYCHAMESFKSLSQLDRLGPETAIASAELLSSALQEPYYLSGPDALSMVDLTPTSGSPAIQPDSFRILLQTRLSSSNEIGLNTLRITPSIDQLARTLVAVIGGAFLLVPMAALYFIQTAGYGLMTVSLFVLLFAVLVAALADQASNQDVLAATAAYAAVLVVVLGQTPQA